MKENKVQWDPDNLNKLVNEIWFKLKKKYKRIERKKKKLKEWQRIQEQKLDEKRKIQTNRLL